VNGLQASSTKTKRKEDFLFCTTNLDNTLLLLELQKQVQDSLERVSRSSHRPHLSTQLNSNQKIRNT
jgi:hypothetical protein